MEQQVVMTVEAEDQKGNWVPVGGPWCGPLDECQENADFIHKAWLDKGWPSDKIRISKSNFRTNRTLPND